MTAMPKTMTTQPVLAFVIPSAWFLAVEPGVATHVVFLPASASCTPLADGGTGNG